MITLVVGSMAHRAVFGVMMALAPRQGDVKCDSSPPPKVTLAAGDATTRIIIGSRNPNRTGVTIVKGGEYVLSARGSWQDGPNIPATDANGTPNDKLPTQARMFLWFFQKLRPVTNANWMALVGKIDASDQKHFLIGVGPTTLLAQADGELVALANDYLHYSNNLYCLEMTIQRTK
jgi:hypothetical protein